jgi:hypothetical protein
VERIVGARFCRACGTEQLVDTPPPGSQADPAPTGVPVEDATDSAEDANATTLSVEFLALESYNGRSDDLGITLGQVVGGTGVFGTGCRPDENNVETFAGAVQLVLMTSPSNVEKAIDGMGMVSFADSRVFGVITDGKERDGSVRLRTDRSGNGVVAVFSADRGIFDEVEHRLGRRGKLNGVSLLADAGALVVDGYATMLPDGTFQRSEHSGLVAAAERHVARPGVTSDHRRTVTASAPEHAKQFVATGASDTADSATEIHNVRVTRPPQAAPPPQAASSVPVGVGGKRRIANPMWLVFAAAAIAAGIVGYAISARDADRTPRQPASATAQNSRAPSPSSTSSSSSSPGVDLGQVGSPIAAAFAAGDYVQFASFRGADNAQAEVSMLQRASVPAVTVASDNAEELLPDWHVVVTGPVEDNAAARRLIRRARRVGIRDAFVRPLTPVTQVVDPVAATGSFSGDLDQRSSQTLSLNKSIATTMTFADDGRSGTAVYRRPSCSARLTLIGLGPVLVYTERIVRGQCTNGGIWRVRPASGGLAVTWRHDSREYYVSGHLER